MALQKYQEDHMDEMEIINLHKKCNKKVRKVSQPPKKALWDTNDPSEEPKKADGKRTTTKAGALQPKKPQKPLSLLIRTQMTQTMSKKPKNHQKPLSFLIRTQMTETMNENIP